MDLQPAGQVVDRVGQPHPLHRAPLVEVEHGVDLDDPLGGSSPGSRGVRSTRARRRRPCRWAGTGRRPCGCRRQRVEQRLVDRQRLAREVERHDGPGRRGCRSSPWPSAACRRRASGGPTSTRSPSQIEPAPDVVERVLEVLVEHRHVAAVDPPALCRPAPPAARGRPGPPGSAAPLGLNPSQSPGTRRGPVAEPLVELQVDDVQPQVERRPARGRPARSCRGRARTVVAPL